METSNKRCMLCPTQPDAQNDPWVSLPCTSGSMEHSGHRPPPGGHPQHCSPRQENQKTKHTPLFGRSQGSCSPCHRGQRNRTCELQEQCLGPQDPRSLPSCSPLSWCLVHSRGRLTPARAVTPDPLPNEDPKAPTRMALSLVPRGAVQCSAMFCYPGPRTLHPQAAQRTSRE